MTAARFVSIFKDEFEARAKRELDFAAMWQAGGPPWTRLMVHSQDKSSVLEQTLQQWSKDSAAEVSLHHWYTIDLMAVTPPYTNNDIDYWSCRPVALVEHENGKDVETEAWKLAYWRAGLKVLVFYRFGSDWLDQKIRRLQKIFEQAQMSCAEQNTEYLLLVGCNENGCVTWRAISWQSGGASWTDRSLATGVRIDR